MGSGIGSVPLEEIMAILSKLMHAAPVVGFKITTRALSLYSIGEVWSMKSNTPRIVFTMDS